MAQRYRDRQAARLEAERAAAEVEAEYHRQFLDRRRAAEFLGISIHKLKRLQTAGQAPVGIKRGDAKQARIVWPLEELVAYRADPIAYLAARAAAPPAGE
jgi:hypothetical protein